MGAKDIKEFMGVWFPGHEQHMVEWIEKRMREHPEELVDGRGTYQYHKLRAAMEHVRRFRVAVDVGAHVGLWSMHLVKLFGHVHAFEPVKLHRICFVENVKPEERYTLYPLALGDQAGMVTINTTFGSSGDSRVVPQPGTADVTLKCLDDVLDASSDDRDRVDFVKVDCEGFELFVLRGGEELLKRCRPCVCVEQKPGFARRWGLPERGAVDYLRSLGAVVRREIGGDFIMSWDEGHDERDEQAHLDAAERDA